MLENTRTTLFFLQFFFIGCDLLETYFRPCQGTDIMYNPLDLLACTTAAATTTAAALQQQQQQQ